MGRRGCRAVLSPQMPDAMYTMVIQSRGWELEVLNLHNETELGVRQGSYPAERQGPITGSIFAGERGAPCPVSSSGCLRPNTGLHPHLHGSNRGSDTAGSRRGGSVINPKDLASHISVPPARVTASTSTKRPALFIRVTHIPTGMVECQNERLASSRIRIGRWRILQPPAGPEAEGQAPVYYHANWGRWNR